MLVSQETNKNQKVKNTDWVGGEEKKGETDMRVTSNFLVKRSRLNIKFLLFKPGRTKLAKKQITEDEVTAQNFRDVKLLKH